MSLIGTATVKLERSDRHLADLTRLIDDYWQRAPFEVIPVPIPDPPDMEPDRVMMTVRVRQPFPEEEVALGTGDTVHNARAALDHLACAAVVAGGGAVTTRTAFPIWRNPVPPTGSQWKKQVHEAMKGSTSRVLGAVQAIEPREGGAHELLWAAHEIDVVDKHRLLIVAAAAYTHLEIDLGTQFVADLPGDLRNHFFGDQVPPELGIALVPQESFPVVDGFDLYNAPRRVIDLQKPRFRFTAALGEPPPFRGKPIIDTLSAISTSVRDVIEQLRPLL